MLVVIEEYLKYPRHLHFKQVVHSLLEVGLLKSNADGKDVIRVYSITPDPSALDGISLLMDDVTNIGGRRKSQSLDGKGA